MGDNGLVAFPPRTTQSLYAKYMGLYNVALAQAKPCFCLVDYLPSGDEDESYFLADGKDIAQPLIIFALCYRALTHHRGNKSIDTFVSEFYHGFDVWSHAGYEAIYTPGIARPPYTTDITRKVQAQVPAILNVLSNHNFQVPQEVYADPPSREHVSDDVFRWNRERFVFALFAFLVTFEDDYRNNPATFNYYMKEAQSPRFAGPFNAVVDDMFKSV